MTLNTVLPPTSADVDAVDAAGDADLLAADVEQERLGGGARILVVGVAGARRAEAEFEVGGRERLVELGPFRAAIVGDAAR